MADHDTHDHTGVPGAGSPTEILDIPTAEIDDTLVLAPDGAGGVEFRAETGGSTFSGARAYHNTTQSVGASITPLNLNNEDFDTDTYHDNSSSNTRMTAPITGYYLVTGHAQFNGSGVNILGLQVNGTPTRGSAVSHSGDGKYQTTQIINMTAAQYVELWGYMATPANVGDASNAENQTSLSIQFLGV